MDGKLGTFIWALNVNVASERNSINQVNMTYLPIAEQYITHVLAFTWWKRIDSSTFVLTRVKVEMVIFEYRQAVAQRPRPDV
jgi:hypothetical protein